ncbi:MAG: 4Fe-4S binding protein [Chlorobium sp.]|nr:4Fe-4S binding protein [Chlorobium sp.]MCW8818873.1 4Fe-4S binding protein [Ignavibacteriaceae bacterium]
MEEAVAKVQRSAGRPVATIMQAQCTGCGICVSVCPVPCIEIVDGGMNFTGTASVIEGLCTGCNFCAIDCPWEAIVMLHPDGSEKRLDRYGKQVKKLRGYA